MVRNVGLTHVGTAFPGVNVIVLLVRALFHGKEEEDEIINTKEEWARFKANPQKYVLNLRNMKDCPVLAWLEKEDKDELIYTWYMYNNATFPSGLEHGNKRVLDEKIKEDFKADPTVFVNKAKPGALTRLWDLLEENDRDSFLQVLGTCDQDKIPEILRSAIERRTKGAADKLESAQKTYGLEPNEEERRLIGEMVEKFRQHRGLVDSLVGGDLVVAAYLTVMLERGRTTIDEVNARSPSIKLLRTQSGTLAIERQLPIDGVESTLRLHLTGDRIGHQTLLHTCPSYGKEDPPTGVKIGYARDRYVFTSTEPDIVLKDLVGPWLQGARARALDAGRGV